MPASMAQSDFIFISVARIVSCSSDSQSYEVTAKLHQRHLRQPCASRCSLDLSPTWQLPTVNNGDCLGGLATWRAEGFNFLDHIHACQH